MQAHSHTHTHTHKIFFALFMGYNLPQVVKDPAGELNGEPISQGEEGGKAEHDHVHEEVEHLHVAAQPFHSQIPEEQVGVGVVAIDDLVLVAVHQVAVTGVQRQSEAHQPEAQVAQGHEPLVDQFSVLAVAHAVHGQHQHGCQREGA